MAQGGTQKYAKHTTQQLEALLTQQKLPADELQLIEDELTRRYTAELLQATKGRRPAPPKQARPPAPGQLAPLPPATPPTNAPAGQKQAKKSRGCGCVWLALLIVAAYVVLYVLANL